MLLPTLNWRIASYALQKAVEVVGGAPPDVFAMCLEKRIRRTPTQVAQLAEELPLGDELGPRNSIARRPQR